MYALVGTVEIDPGRAEQAVVMLNDQLVPQVKAMSGFVSGTWARSVDGRKGYSIVIFATEEAANAAMERARRGPPPEAPVKVLSSEVCELMAQA